MIHDPDRYWFDMIRDTEPYQRWARRFLGGLVLVMVGVFIGASAKAQTVPRNAAEISFTYATANTDGTAIPATCPSGQTLCGRIASTRIEYGSCGSQNSFGTKVGEISVSPPGMKALVSNLVVQTYCFRGFHRNDYSLDSVSSNVVTKTISAPTPAPPGIAIDTVAFEIKPNSSGALVATRIGLVPLGTGCGDRQQTVGAVTYSLVPRSTVDVVNWPANLKLVDVWARCG